MSEVDDGGRATLRVLAIGALALLGLAFSATPIAARLDAALLDFQWAALRAYLPRSTPDEIVVVGLDEATSRSAQDLAGVLNEPLGTALARIAAARPRALALDLALPERSYESIKPGLDRTLLAGLAAARRNGPLVAALTIDARTREAKPIYTPYLAVLGEEGLGLGILARDADGVSRRFSLGLPTEDGSFPTLVGRVCRALARDCGDGLIHYALGPAYVNVPMSRVLEARDPQILERLFRDRIVMVGATQRFVDRIDVPVNLAAWEEGGRTSPSVVVHAQSLRTALAGASPVEVSRPAILVLLALAALVALIRDWRVGLGAAVLGGAVLVIGSAVLLRAGTYLPISAALATLAFGWAGRGLYQRRRRRRAESGVRESVAGYVSKRTLQDLLAGTLALPPEGEERELAFLSLGVGDAVAGTDREAMGRFHELAAAAIHRHEGTIERFRGDGVDAFFGAPRAAGDACRKAWDAAQDVLLGIERVNAARRGEGKPALDVAVGLDYGNAWVGLLGPASRRRFGTLGPGPASAARLEGEARHGGLRGRASGAFHQCVGAVPALEPSGEAWGWRT